jgi:hypothetical protein
VPSNVTALIPVNAIGDPATLAVDYSLVSNPVDGFSFGITVGDGDVDYNTKTYYFRVNKLAAQIPCLTALTVMVRSIDFLNPNFDRVRFAYDAVIPATATETEAVVSWDYDPSVVQSVFTAVDGSAWALETGYGITLTGLTPGASKLVRIKARTFEGNEAEYTITVSHAVSTAAQLVNIRKWMITSWVQISNFAPGTYYYAEPVGSQNITLEITPPTDGTWQASVDGVTTIGESSSIGTFEVQDLAVGIPKIVIITSKAQDGVSTAIYTVVLTRNGDTTTQLLNIQVGGTAGKTAFDSGLFQSDRFNYAVTLGYSNSGTVILTPTLAGGVIDTAYLHVYTIINGLEAAASTTSANLTPIENSQDIVVFQVRNKDTGQPSVVYTVIVSKKGNTDNKLKALSVRKNEESGDELKGSIAPSLGSTAAQEEEKLASDYNYTLYLSNDTDRVYITPSAAATSEIWYSITNGGAITAYTRFSGASFGVIDITPDSNVVVAIQVRPQDASAGWSVYTLVLRKTVISYLYTYTSPAPYTWTAPLAGIYNFELWGAQGGRGLNTIPDNGGAAGGTGGYIKAKKTLSAGSVLYLYPGQQGNGPSTTSDRNGGAQVYGGGGAGGKSTHQTIFAGGGSGGGATFVSTVYNTGTVYASAPISDTDVRVNFALIAGGGGGTSNGQVGGRGSGTDTGGSAYSKSGSIISGATSSVGSGNGIGQTGRVGNSGSGGDHGAGGGGGGYYGGLAQQASGSNTDAGGSGGNGYINTASGWMLLDTDRVGNTGAGDFKNIPKPSDAGTEAGHSGAGFIRITYMGQ